jgi:trehalose 6-phosphate phosphatase
MPEPLVDVEGEVLQRIGQASSVFCFLDYGGTLAPLMPTPDEAVPLPGTADVLRDLAALPGVQVAVVSGRPVANVRRFLDVAGLYYVGIHGVEVRFPNGETTIAEGVGWVRTIIPSVKRRLEQALHARPGILIEDKGAALACHYRLASVADGVTARQLLAAVVRSYQRRGVRLRVTFGHEVAEVRTSHVDKGTSAAALLAAHGPAALPIYIGDDLTDEDAFTLLPLNSITILVGPAAQPTAARYRTETPQDVQRFLRALLERRRHSV